MTDVTDLHQSPTNAGPPRVTINDVARSAGVSVATVSKVINGRYGVAVSTSERVQRVIDELGYESSLVARRDRKSTRLNSSHANISYAVFCLKKKENVVPPIT